MSLTDWLRGVAAMGALASGLVWVPVCLGAPAARGYEMVSPLGKNGADVEFDGPARASADGTKLAYNTFGNFGGDGGSGGIRNQLFASRSDDSWVTRNINPPLDSGSIGRPAPSLIYPWFTDDLSGGIAHIAQIDPTLGGSVNNVVVLDSATNAFTPISHPETPIPGTDTLVGYNFFGGASDDLSHVAFVSGRALTSEVLDDPLAAANDDVCECFVYEWANGQLRLVSRLPEDEGGGIAGGGAERVAIGRGFDTGLYNLQPGLGAVSADGSRVFFSVGEAVTAGGASRLYVRQGDSVSQATVAVSRDERSDCFGDPSCGGDGQPDPLPDAQTGLAQFQSADAAGTTAYFSSPDQLTDDSTASGNSTQDLYRWDGDAPEGQRLTDLTIQDPGSGQVLGVVGTSDDSSRVYFVAEGDLAAGASEGRPNLYLWQQDEGLRFISTLDDAIVPSTGATMEDQGVWSFDVSVTSEDYPHFRDARVSGDGERLVFRSRAQLTDYDTAGTRQLYLYDASDDQLTCVSCNPRATSSSANAWFKRKGVVLSVPPFWLMRNLSDDGKRVLFDSAEALVEEDANGRSDVYQWEDGAVTLVSSGSAADDSVFVDASASGDDVFFATRQQLACQDTDNLIDIYDARVGSGPPASCSTPPACEDDLCQGALPSLLTFLPPATSTFAGPGDSVAKPVRKQPKKCRRNQVRKRVGGKVKCVRRHAGKRRKASRRTRHGQS
jgi:hypothetical protein